MKTSKNLSLQYLFTCLLLFMAVRMKADGSSIFNCIVRLPRTEAIIYQSLVKITEGTGYLLIYDSKLIDNERKIKLRGGERTVRQTIYDIIGSDGLQLRSVGKHIIISQPETIVTTEWETSSHKGNTFFFTLGGVLIDQLSREPIPYATVSVQGTSIGNVNNQNGGFRLNLPDSLQSRRIHFSHLGYVPQTTDVSLFVGRSSTFALEPKVIPLQEAIVRIINPIRLLKEILRLRKKNYLQNPVYPASFYGEGVEQKNRFISLIEGIFEIHKAPPDDSEKAG